jgi:hypothetical protein
MQYRSAKDWSKSSPCTNVPIHCLLCKQGPTGNHGTVWKYNIIFHLLTEQSEDGETLPHVPTQLWIDSFIKQIEKDDMGVGATITAHRARYGQLDSDAVEQMAGVVRNRSESSSTTASDAPVTKCARA